jgi:hypothetical protein
MESVMFNSRPVEHSVVDEVAIRAFMELANCNRYDALEVARQTYRGQHRDMVVTVKKYWDVDLVEVAAQLLGK